MGRGSGDAPSPEPGKVGVVALDIRLPKPLHRELRRIALSMRPASMRSWSLRPERMLAERKR